MLPVRTLLLFVCLGFTLNAICQQTDSIIQTQPTDTLRANKFQHRINLVREGIKATNKKYAEKYQSGKLVIQQNRVLEEMKKVNQQAKNFIKERLDTPLIKKDIDHVQQSLEITKDGVFSNVGTSQTQRNLTVTETILSKLLNLMSKHKISVDNYANQLTAFRNKIDSLSTDSSLYEVPGDSIHFVQYVKHISVLAKEMSPIDSAIDKSLTAIQDLQLKVDVEVLELKGLIEDVGVYRKDLSLLTFKREFGNIWSPVLYSRPISEIVYHSFAKEKLTLQFYTGDSIGRIVVLLLLIGIVTIFLRTLKQKIITGDNEEGLHNGHLVIKFPFLSACIIVISLFQFFFLDPPFIFSFCLWMISLVCLIFIFKNYISGYWMKFWIVLIVLFILASADNFLLQASRAERWIMLGLSLTGIVYCINILLKGKFHELKEKRIVYFIVFVILLEIASALFNIYGRYNFSKTLLIMGYIGVVIAIMFLWVVRLINETLYLSSKVYTTPDKKMLYLNFDKVGKKVPAFFYVLLVVGWFILIAKNFYAYKQIVAPFNDFLNADRTLGDYTFSIYGLFIFLLIMFCAMVLSRIVSFFASDTETTDQQKKGASLGSWLLLIRILIISLGLFLAIAATGLPIDKITIVIGALGVGIGLGLQGLVNNLVSGLIIAFEKPVNVGDIVELNGQIGIMKSIGFRSSIITLFDGSSVVIPNGDILSHHVINWTMSKNKKRLIIPVGVSYGSDLEKVHAILATTMDNDDRILKYPEPIVLARGFNESAVDFELRFWVKHIKDSFALTSDIISRIDLAFKKEGIVIPFPQRDVHFRSPGNTE
ncbi:mechanosensitive ion channel [Danxiaibacter flavus]|uniref:Mechanosensitive ion channel n=1 Tax=Danxiaibacter flavus TaxID=3049108 RepID=A0ABV3ZKI4_9BACT|nr:mechanosensitive ion channel [Chitinophagaceae bacterium DXS]